MPAVTELINSDIDTVWRHLTVPELMLDWMRSVDRLRTSDGAPLQDRTELLFMARGRQRRSTVIDFEEMRSFALRSVQGPVTAVYRYSLQPVKGGTSVRLDVSCDAVGPLRIIAPIIRKLMWKTDGDQLALLKNAVESNVR